MLSYSLGSLKLETLRDDMDDIDYGQIPGFDIFRTREPSIRRQLENFGYMSPSDSFVERLKEILDDNKFNIRFFLAADLWFVANDKPKVFTKDMFTPYNPSFLKVTNVIFGDGKKGWNFDSLSSFVTYAKFIRDNLYRETDNIIVVEEDSDDDYF